MRSALRRQIASDSGRELVKERTADVKPVFNGCNLSGADDVEMEKIPKGMDCRKKTEVQYLMCRQKIKRLYGYNLIIGVEFLVAQHVI